MVIRQTDVRALERTVHRTCYFDHNLCVTQFDSVFIYGLSYGRMPVLFSIHRPHSDCLQVNPDRKLIAARSNLKSQPQRPTWRAADTATDYCLAELTADKRSGLSPGPFLNVSTLRLGRFWSWVLSWRAAQMSCSVSSLLSDQMVTGGTLAGGDSAT